MYVSASMLPTFMNVYFDTYIRAVGAVCVRCVSLLTAGGASRAVDCSVL